MSTHIGKLNNNAKKKLSTKEKKRYFEESKYINFLHSSKLEGINITPVSESIDQLVEKYKMIGINSSGR